MTAFDYDVLVIGSGFGGSVSAARHPEVSLTSWEAAVSL
jgi:pyruvate/2-oxoglutarate dehydrogenase complex dihydrolipoamide dehydrogenase (E3) component